VLGHALPMLRHPLRFVESLRRHGSVVRISLGPTPVYVVNDPELLHRVMVTDASGFTRGRVFDRARRFFGDGLATVAGDAHVRQRRLLQPAFRRDQVSAYLAAMWRAAEEKAGSWRPGQVLAVNEEMDDLSISVLARTMFASTVSSAEARELSRAVDVVIRGAAVRAALPVFVERLPLPANRRYGAAIARLRAIVADIVTVHRADGALDDVVTMLMAARDAASGLALSDVQLRDEIISILIAGTDSAAATIAWAFHELGGHPDVERRLHAELDVRVDGPPDGHEWLRRLEYTGRVLAETMRLHALWMTMRRTLVPVELGGVRIPAGTEVMFSPYALHRDPAVFPEPNRFDPDRWHPERARELLPHTFIPFGAGIHRCLGEHFATAEATLAIAAIARRWRLRPVPGHRVREVASALVYPDHLPMTAELRS